MGTVVGISRAGRPALPTALKALKGTLRPSRVNESEPAVKPIKIGAPPADADELEQQIWRDLASAVNGLGVAASGDRKAFASMVHALRLADMAYQAGDIDGFCKLDARWEKWASHFGLTPATRAKVNRLAAPEKKKFDPLDEFTVR